MQSAPRTDKKAGMANTPTTGFRLAPELLKRVDDYAERLSNEAGVRVTRAAAVSKLLDLALGFEAARMDAGHRAPTAQESMAAYKRVMAETKKK